MDRPDRVRRHELHLQTLALPQPDVPESRPFTDDRVHLVGEPAWRQADVNEAWRRHGHFVDRAIGGPCLHLAGNRGGDLQRRHTGRAGQAHRQARRVVAVFRPLGAFDWGVRHRHSGQFAGVLRSLDRLGDEMREVVLDHIAPKSRTVPELPGAGPARLVSTAPVVGFRPYAV